MEVGLHNFQVVGDECIFAHLGDVDIGINVGIVAGDRNRRHRDSSLRFVVRCERMTWITSDFILSTESRARQYRSQSPLVIDALLGLT